MIEYEQFCFAAPPRTGNLWFRAAARICGLNELNVDDEYNTFHPVGKLKVTIVRHPFNWLGSCYISLCSGMLNSDNIILQNDLNYRDSFRVFLLDYLDTCPGSVGKFFDFYKADSMIRIEDLPEAFVELAATLGVDKIWQDTVRDLPELNASHWLPSCTNLIQDIIKAEKELCETYDYW